MSKKKNYKICLIGNSLTRGGSERALSNLSLFFHEKGIEVHNIIFEDLLGYDYSGKLFNLGKFKANNYYNKAIRYKKLYDYIKKEQFDYIIDLRYRGAFYSEYILSKFVFGQTNYIPSVRGYRLYGYFTTNLFVAKHIYSKAYAIVTVSKEIEKEVQNKYNYTNTKTIYNVIEAAKIRALSEEKKSLEINFRYIIALGRMAENNIKQHDVMIRAYSKSVLPKHGIKLVLVGDGIRRQELGQLAFELGISDNIVFTGFQKNPFPYLKGAEFMLMASKNEGFPNVILESFACGTPVVSYDCKSGPKEIINHKQNGILVEDQNFDELIKAMNLMVEDQKLYEICKSNTLQSVQQFLPEIIGKQWLELMKIEINA